MLDNLGRIFTYKNFYESRTPVNTNYEKSWFLQDTNMRISAIIRIYMLAANFYRDSPMLGVHTLGYYHLDISKLPFN